MLVGYRRMSGKVNLSETEAGTRGSWWEKRKAFFSFLHSRGHIVEVLDDDAPRRSFDILFVEFGSRNSLFYKKSLEATRLIVNRPHGQVIYLCDDPDLPYEWKHVLSLKNWVIWANSVNGCDFSCDVPCRDFPFSSLQTPRPASHLFEPELVYIGRPLGRRASLSSVLDSVSSLRVYSKPQDWKGWSLEIRPSPTQVARSDFYNRRLACLGLADRKHHALGWRTGRIFHAAMAGCPPIIEHEHISLRFRYPIACFRHPSEIPSFLGRVRDPVERSAYLELLTRAIVAEKYICEERFREVGL
jgi:hypothetical protein